MYPIAHSSLNNLLSCERPEYVTQKGSIAFDNIRQHTKSEWGLFNGESDYGLLGINEKKLTKQMMMRSSKHTFRVLEIGCGNAQLLYSFADFFNTQPDLSNKKIELYGIRGESYLGAEIEQIGRCKLIILGAFKVEELLKEFRNRGYFLENKINFIISRWCFRHLADPLRTFLESFVLLSKNGKELTDGFFYMNEDSFSPFYQANLRLIELLFYMKVPFLMQKYNQNRSLNQILIEKRDIAPLEIPLTYSSIFTNEECPYLTEADIGSSCVVRFKKTTLSNNENAFRLPTREDALYGDRELYEELKGNEVFLTDQTPLWFSIINHTHNEVEILIQDAEEKFETLMNAVLLNNPVDVRIGTSGGTLLHGAIIHDCKKSFLSLLAQGANINSRDNQGHTPLHRASIHDFNGFYIQEIVNREAWIEANANNGMRPLDCALESKNIKGIEILLTAKARYLDESVFEPLGIVPPPVLSDQPVLDMIRWIQKGDCLILLGNHYEISYFKEYYLKETSRCIYIKTDNINHYMDLLNDKLFTLKQYDSERIKLFNFEHVFHLDLYTE